MEECPYHDVEACMGNQPNKRSECSACREGQILPFPFSMAFQPIVHAASRTVYAYEALTRGPAQEPAATVLSQLDETNLYAFDQACRVKAIELASGLDLAARNVRLSINFIPNAVYRPEACIRTTVEAATRMKFPMDRLIFEVTEGEKIQNHEHLNNILTEYKRRGFLTAIDDFGAGFAGLSLLAKFQPDIVKIDMELTREIDQRPVSRTIVASVLTICRDLGILPIAEGIETVPEFHALQDMGVTLFQGYLFARPGFESLPAPIFPD